MSHAAEVDLTSRGSVRFLVSIMAVSLACTLAGVIAAIVAEPQWWVIALGALAVIVVALLTVGVSMSIVASARDTESLRKTGTVAQADVTHGERIDDGEDVRYVLTLTIRPAGSAAFTVTHRCGKSRCRLAQLEAPTTIPVLVDAERATWAVIHD